MVGILSDGELPYAGIRLVIHARIRIGVAVIEVSIEQMRGSARDGHLSSAGFHRDIHGFRVPAIDDAALVVDGAITVTITRKGPAVPEHRNQYQHDPENRNGRAYRRTGRRWCIRITGLLPLALSGIPDFAQADKNQNK